MIGVDTNVFVRYLVPGDNSAQHEASRRLIGNCTAASPCFIAAGVLLETFWVLTRTFGYPIDRVAVSLQRALHTDGIVFEYGRAATVALSHPRDFADTFIAAGAMEAGAYPIYTFDRRASRQIEGMERLTHE